MMLVGQHLIVGPFELNLDSLDRGTGGGEAR